MYVIRKIKSFMRNEYGRQWPWYFIILVIIVFWPLVYFWPLLQFEPVKFTEEWIKTGITGLLLYIIIRIATELRATTKSANLDISKIEIYILHVEKLKQEISSRENSLKYPNPSLPLEEQPTTWKRLMQLIRSNQFLLNNQAANQSLLSLNSEINFNKMESIIDELYEATNYPQLNIKEFEELIGELQNLHTGLLNIKANLLNFQ